MPAARRLYLLPLALCLALACAGVRLAWRGLDREAPAPRAHVHRYGVATENAAATRVGIEALRAGAHAVDAAISVALTLGVVQPASSGIGGGGFALVWDAAQRKVTALDFREVAPGAIDPADLEYRPKEVIKSGRGRMIGVPGEVAGLAELHRRFGRRSFAEDAAPAIALAEHGYATSDHLARLAVAYHAQINYSSPIKALFKPDGYAVGVGRRIVNRDLAATLRRIGAEGPKAFYEGEVAAEIVQAAQATGGSISLSDLRAYRPVEREPLKIGWEGHTVYTMPPPSAGGLLLAETLGMFGKADSNPSASAAQRTATCWQRRFVAPSSTACAPSATRASSSPTCRRSYRRGACSIGAPRSRTIARAPCPRLSCASTAPRTSWWSTPRATWSPSRRPSTAPSDSLVSTETTGILLNDELDDFTTKAAAAMFTSSAARLAEVAAEATSVDASRVPASSTDIAGPNAPRPFARPTSSMTPTLAFRDGLPVLALGGSGGLRIATGVTQALLARMVFALPVTDCVALPRVHTPTGEASSAIEIDENVAESVVHDLRNRGETVRLGPNYSAVQMIAIDREPSGATRISAASDPRKGGTALSSDESVRREWRPAKPGRAGLGSRSCREGKLGARVVAEVAGDGVTDAAAFRRCDRPSSDLPDVHRNAADDLGLQPRGVGADAPRIENVDADPVATVERVLQHRRAVLLSYGQDAPAEQLGPEGRKATRPHRHTHVRLESGQVVDVGDLGRKRSRMPIDELVDEGVEADRR